MVRLFDGRVLKCHVDHIRKQTSMEPSNAQDVVLSHKESLSFEPLLTLGTSTRATVTISRTTF